MFSLSVFCCVLLCSAWACPGLMFSLFVLSYGSTSPPSPSFLFSLLSLFSQSCLLVVFFFLCENNPLHCLSINVSLFSSLYSVIPPFLFLSLSFSLSLIREWTLSWARCRRRWMMRSAPSPSSPACMSNLMCPSSCLQVCVRACVCVCVCVFVCVCVHLFA